MITSIAIVTGFQKEIRDKTIGFGSHVVISNYDNNVSFEQTPIEKNKSFIPILNQNKEIKHIQIFATKPGIIKTKDDIQGVVLKGIGSDFNWEFFESNIILGKSFDISESKKTKNVLISSYNANKLNINVGDKLRMYFVMDPPGARAFKVSGIYETGLEEFDRKFVLCDIAEVQKLNKWNKDQVGGFEVLIHNFDKLDEIGEFVHNEIDYDLNSATIKELHPEIFEWLKMLNINVVIILTLMIIVSGITIISTLLILLLEKTNMIGILKSFGMRNKGIYKIFLYNAIYLIGQGFLWGNLIAITICLLQKYFGFIKLDQRSYFVSKIPVNLDIVNILMINTGTFIICVIMLFIPAYIISRITPVKAIRFS